MRAWSARGRRRNAAVLAVLLSGVACRAVPGTGPSRPAHGTSAPGSIVVRSPAPDRLAVRRRLRAEALAAARCRRSGVCTDPHPVPTRPPSTTGRPRTTVPSSSAPASTAPSSTIGSPSITGTPTTFRTTTVSTAPASSTTSTTLPRCDPATSRCPRDLTPALAAAGLSSVDVTDLSDTGEVVGAGQLSTGEFAAFRLPASGPARILHPPPGADAVVAGGVNSHGLVAGYAVGADTRPFVWDAVGGARDITAELPTFGGSFVDGYADGVNERGQVVGTYSVVFESPGPPPTGATTTSTEDHGGEEVGPSPTVSQTTGPPMSPPTAPSASSAPSTAAATTAPPTYRHESRFAFVWDSASDRVTVVNPEAASSALTTELIEVMSIGGGGVLVGHVDGRATRWRPRPGGYAREDLGFGYANAVNAEGAVVGAVLLPEDAVLARGVYWPADSTVPVRLPGPVGRPAELVVGSDLNDAGVIVGGGTAGSVSEPLRWPDRATRPPERLDPDGAAQASALAVNAAGATAGMAQDGPPWRVLVWGP
jgi:hypothetical protein